MRLGRRLPRALVATCGWFALFAGQAQGAGRTAALETTRAPGASDCPDAVSLAAVVNDGLGRVALVTQGESDPGARVAVSFERAARGYLATVRIGGARGGTRKVSNAGPGCGALASAVGVLLIVVLDADAPADAPASAAASTSPATGSTASPPTRPAPTADVGVAGGVAQGLVGGWSPSLGVGGTLAYRRWAARLGAAWLPTKSYAYGPGRVEVGLTVARLALCASPSELRARLTLELCVQQQLGWMTGRGLDYEASNHAAGHAWLATGASVVVGGPLARSLGWEAEAGVTRVLRRERFVVDNLGTAFQSDALAFMTTLAFTTRVW